MPRYCAVKVCSNRGGTTSRQDNKRISFYPFPLQDKPRLKKWVDNMKREDWTPSRHQYLCSEHFTEDCFDIRWGIRYLKNTAIPTVFPSPEHDGEKNLSTIKRSPKANPKTFNSDIELTGFDSPLSKRPLILSRTCRKVQSTTVHNAGQPHVSDSDFSCHSNLPEEQNDACGTQEREPSASSQCTETHSAEHTNSTITVLCCESLGSPCNGETNADALQVALGQTFSFVPEEVVKDDPSGCYSEEGGPSEGEHISVYEHSYCRPDTDKDQLWSRILSLHAKLLELDRREESTLAKIHALETEIGLLKRDGATFKDKQKVLEDYISSVLL